MTLDKETRHLYARSALGKLLDALYGGAKRGNNSHEILNNIADYLDGIDDVTDALLADGGSGHKVGREMQEDLRRIAEKVQPAWHGDGDECIGIHCINPEHGWTEYAASQPVATAEREEAER